MHQTILVQRRSAAVSRILERSQALATHLELDPQLTQNLQPTGIRDPQVVEMMRLEALANLMDQLAENVGVEPAAVTTVTVNEFIAPREEQPDPRSADQVAADDLPAPVLDEDKPARKTRAKRDKPTSRKG